MGMMRIVIASLAFSATALGAQSAKLPPAQVCDMSARVLILSLVDSSGTALPDAAISVRRLRTGTRVERAEATGGGSYLVLEDGTLPDLRRGGEPFEVKFRRGNRRRRVRVRIGMDDSGCHVRFITVPPKIVF